MLQAGAAKASITPKAGTHLSGSVGTHRPAESVLDPLYAKAAVFESDGRRILLIALDVTIVTEDFTSAVRTKASQEFGFDPDAIMVHATQTHSAPGCGNFMLDPDFPLAVPKESEYLRGGEIEYFDFAVERTLKAVREAVDRLGPVQIGANSGVCADQAFSRRAITRDGSISMPWPMGSRQQPLGPNRIRYMEGPIDPEVGVVCVRNEAMAVEALLLHHTCHPVNVFGSPWSGRAVSADWPGAWSQELSGLYGEGAVSLVLNGCCGNINPWDPFDPDFVPDHRRMGRTLAEVTRRVVAGLEFTDAAAVDWKVRRVGLPYRDVPPARQEEVDRILSENPAPRWLPDNPAQIDGRWFMAASTKSIEYSRRRMPELVYEIQVLRVGDIALVGLPGEPFVEGQLAIKLQSPTYPTYVAHCTTTYVGYIPTREAHARGGHESNPDCPYWAKLAPEALDIVIANAVELLHEVFVE